MLKYLLTRRTVSLSFLLQPDGFLPHQLQITQNTFLVIFFRRLQAIEKERSPQVLAIRHREEGQREDYHEDEDSGGFGIDSSDEEQEREPGDSQDTASPDSSFRSLSPGELALKKTHLLFLLKSRQNK